jgi:phosphatidylserine decarboxylase
LQKAGLASVRAGLIRSFLSHLTGFEPAGELARPQAERYTSFNDFFTRRLRAEARSLDPDAARGTLPR